MKQIDQMDYGKDACVGQKDVNNVLSLVACGKQDELERILQIKPELALMLGNVTDSSNRRFEEVTPLQYALWALDWHMWTMIIKFLSKVEISNQIKKIEASPWAKQHGLFVSWQSLLNSFQKIIILCEQSRWMEATLCWQKEVGKAQSLLPVHVVNEYCHPDRPFEPCPDFTANNSLPRSCQTNIGEWFTAKFNNGSLGETFAYFRYTFKEVQYGTGEILVGVWWGEGEVASSEYNACSNLYSVRKQQRDEFISKFL